MINKHITKILNVWKTENKIEKPRKTELAIKLIDQIASMFAAGSYYYYILDFESLEMEFVHKGTKEVLGISPSGFSLAKLFDLMHPEDLEAMHKKEEEATKFLFNKISTEEIPLYKVVYLIRLKHSRGKYKTILHQAQTTHLSLDGKIQQVIGVHTDVSYLNIPFDHKISFISNERPSYYSIAPDISLELLSNSIRKIYSPREKEIIIKISEGKNSSQIADDLSLSLHTVNTHKKNILRKSHCNNTTELIAWCIREGVI